jgi:hypothetical protein
MSSLFARNEGAADRAFRVVLGLGLLSQTFMGWHTPWAYVGVIPLVTGIVGTCPMYSLFGFSSCPPQRTV